jgi:hypothetical protein
VNTGGYQGCMIRTFSIDLIKTASSKIKHEFVVACSVCKSYGTTK